MGKRKDEKELQETFDQIGGDAEVLREWDLSVEKIRQVRGVLKLYTSSGPRMLKKVNVSDARLRFIHESLEHLYLSGLTSVPRFIRTKYGDPYVVHPTGLYYLTNWMPGKEADLKKTKNLFLAAETLARFHNAGTGFEGGGFGQETREDFSALWGKYRAKLASYDEHLEERRDQTIMDNAYVDHRKELLKMIDHAVEQLNDTPYGAVLEWAREHKTICHGSYSRQNLIVDKERMSVVDLDHCHFGHPIQDLGAMLSRYMPRFGWDAEIGFSILDVYREVREITKEEMTVLAAYLSFPSRTLQVVEAYFERTRDWEVERFTKNFRKSLALDRGRETFVQDLIDRYNLTMEAPSFAPQLDDVGSYDLEDDESSSVEARHDGWEENQGNEHDEESGPISVQVENQEVDVTLARFEDDDELIEESGQRITHVAHARQARPKTKRAQADVQPRRRPNTGGPTGPWTPGR
ncbi:CotS family spore coat protein [Tumebacillus sp. ITR2]|uniref:CotS family spore coat protein n=1 Tax=Tumebacillus amylolyticus TaxID=2801339 RepID=A0ABS1J9X6_9BACL|nr:CotS family spore coat protein [Tumebacillus amylolyticus]MBL0387084.1 CotS family spore coat protein [Tumebacillus amylolyticus]